MDGLGVGSRYLVSAYHRVFLLNSNLTSQVNLHFLVEQIWYSNVPHAKLAKVKGHQNWVKVTGEYLTFPGGGTQFKQGALHYIDFIQKASFCLNYITCFFNINLKIKNKKI